MEATPNTEVFTPQELKNIRDQFPILNQSVNQCPLIYFDNAATTQKPQAVIERLIAFYQTDNANIHRSVHTLGQRSTDQYETARQTLSQFIGSQDDSQIIFTSGTTAAINFLARGFAEPKLTKGDQILTTALEHHSNLVPWQELCQRTGAHLVYLPLTENTMTVDFVLLNKMDTTNVKFIVIQHVSNVLGIEQPIKQLTDWAHQRKIAIIVDGAQAVPHLSINVEEMGVDAYCFSGHKLYGPTGIGVCYLKSEHHQSTQAVNFGGEMINQVNDFDSNYKNAPWKFEAGTPPIAEAIALAQAVTYLKAMGLHKVFHQEYVLSNRLYQGLKSIEGVQLYHPLYQSNFHGIISFNLDNIHPHDAATAYDYEGIALRAGHHCAQPLMRYLKVPATLRASLAFYNTVEEVDSMLEITRAVKEFFTNALK
ncbi:SufS family cysteine desulfurase [Fundicoccus culcitae]|uniref:Cysteine desulfurase n=1 Tax=Fundicoccus culcitae TaxID=2969821 RepID=A0ABY5P5Y7_9LACT|nr:SufS family cysteine desulfurase [Fundicoccus culcitae]UUX34151.1 SufS family cysteine desulfurase [Fundicoccus culcitae]